MINGDLIGEFEIVSGKAAITDPCYDLDHDGSSQKLLDNVKIGTWNLHIPYTESMGERPSELICLHLDHQENYDWQYGKRIIGVDSGQAGMFDIQHFKDDNIVEGVERICKDPENIVCEDEPWYSIVADRSLSEECGGVIPFGAVSSSGHGDGLYTYYTKEHEGQIVGVKVVFIEEEMSERERFLEDED